MAGRGVGGCTGETGVFVLWTRRCVPCAGAPHRKYALSDCAGCEEEGIVFQQPVQGWPCIPTPSPICASVSRYHTSCSRQPDCCQCSQDWRLQSDQLQFRHRRRRWLLAKSQPLSAVSLPSAVTGSSCRRRWLLARSAQPLSALSLPSAVSSRNAL